MCELLELVFGLWLMSLIGLVTLYVLWKIVEWLAFGHKPNIRP
jgi:hypothetical protein